MLKSSNRAMSPPPDSKFIRAFTLAETLITLGIIGVVAALTIPNIIVKYQKIETVTQLKKTYNVLNEAVKRAEAVEGDSKNWDYTISSNDFYYRYLKPYLVITKEYIDDTNAPCEFQCLKGTGNCNGYGSNNIASSPKIVLEDGTIIGVDVGTNEKFKVIVVNINGIKGPNRWGRDIFAFALLYGKRIVPYGLSTDLHTGEGVGAGTFGDEYNRDSIINANNRRACNKNKDGVWCAALILLDGWEIKDTYPW